MTNKQKALIAELIASLPEEQKTVYQSITDYLSELGYVPQKQQVKDFIISFKHNTNGKVLAKIGISKQIAFISIRFFACKNVSQKYINALHHELVSRNGQYSSPTHVNPIGIITNKCGHCGDICTGGGLGYYYKYPNGKEVSRCGAYPIIIPDISETDIDEMKAVLFEQHSYFLSLA